MHRIWVSTIHHFVLTLGPDRLGFEFVKKVL